MTGEPFSSDFLLGLMTRAPKAFWRFDVDFSLDAAVRMAEFAETAGVRGTFYVMATGSFYNPFSIPGTRALRAIYEHGHSIGLHVDERVGEDAHSAWSHTANLAVNGSGAIDALRVSFHMPSVDVLWQDFSEFTSAYAARWQGHYVSDSRREWDDEKTARLITNQGEGVQVCLHPEHYQF